MPTFAYTARDQQGKRVTGTLVATSQREAVTTLAGKSLFPLQVKAEVAKKSWSSNRRVNGQQLATLYSQLAGLLRSGVPMLRSLEVLAKQSSNEVMKSVLEDVRSRVEEGTTLSDAMRYHPRTFDDLAVSMVRAGSEGGFLEDALNRIGQFTEQQEDLKARTMGALAYPIFLAVVGVVVVFGLLVFFVPNFGTVFEDLRKAGKLPAITEWLMWTSETLTRWGLVLLALLGVLVWYLRKQLATEKGRYFADKLRMQMPLFGGVYQSLAVARFCRVLGTLLHNGVPILKSLEISRDAAGNRILSAAIQQASENISGGDALATPLAASGYFPETVVEMIAVAEESNTLDKVLVDVADGLERRTGRRLDLLVRLLEPVMLLILAGIVLVVVIALLLPIFKMTSNM